MVGLALLWGLIVVLFFISVPLALILSVIALNTSKRIERQIQRFDFSDKSGQTHPAAPPISKSCAPSIPALRPMPQAEPAAAISNPTIAPAASPAQMPSEQENRSADTVGALLDIPSHIRLDKTVAPQTCPPVVNSEKRPPRGAPMDNPFDLEWTIAGRIGLLVGAVLALMGAGYFVKYVYQHMLFGPWLRVSLVAAGGAVAWLIGHNLRRKQFALSAKVITALGFGLLFTAILSAHTVYALLDPAVALSLSGIAAALALGYAVFQKDPILGFLALGGGFASAPIIFSAQVLTMPVFGYLLILAILGIATSHWTQATWYRWVSALGVYGALAVWLYSFPDSQPKHLLMLWLGIFAGLFWFAAVWQSIWRRCVSAGQDVGLLLLNDAAWLYCLWKMLPTDAHRALLATWLAAGGVIHLAFYALVVRRSPKDRAMMFALTLSGLLLLNVAAAVYFTSMNLKIVLWTAQAAILTLAACRWKSGWAGWAAVFLMIAAACWLVEDLPLHKTVSFRFLFNPAFGVWMWTAAMAAVCALFCRFVRAENIPLPRFWLPFYHILAVGAAGAACFLEWYAYCRWQIGYESLRQTFWVGGGLISAAVVAALWLRPLPPPRDSVWAFGFLAAVAAGYFGCWVIAHARNEPFAAFFNPIFGSVFAIIAAMGASAYQHMRKRDFPSEAGWRFAAGAVALLTIWAASSFEIWHSFRCAGKEEWDFWASMVISIAWTVYGAVLVAAGFAFGQRSLRYFGLAVFAVLVSKLVIVDIQYLPAEYRIAAFLTAGGTLLAIGVWYQAVKKNKARAECDKTA